MSKWKVVKIHTGFGTGYTQYRGKSTWVKPLDGPKTGDELLEMDTGAVFMFDGEEKKWWPL